ncbi:hypothetical protein ACOI1C_12210 [Bacillus sp. DJP31]|uniref:hypothetical protein n=1 Tax=Bacillus sp. DJP31 TaxID=3409789 RepID=UPI003BB4BEDC
MPIFKDTKEALKQAKIGYFDGFKAIATEFELESINHKNYKDYKTYGWQITVMTSKDVQQQGVDISKFFDIYENSFKN